MMMTASVPAPMYKTILLRYEWDGAYGVPGPAATETVDAAVLLRARTLRP